MMLLRLGGFLVVVLYTSVGRFGFPKPSRDRRRRMWYPNVGGWFSRTGNGVLIVSDQLSAMSDQLEQRQVSLGKYECLAIRLHESLGVVLNPISIRFHAMIWSEGSRLGR
jgi:hypothetical protein